MKKCPYCAEEIQDEAIRCRFCNQDLSAPPTKSNPPVTNTASADQILKGCGSLFFVGFGIYIIYLLSDCSPKETKKPVKTVAESVPSQKPDEFDDIDKKVDLITECENLIKANAVLPQSVKTSFWGTEARVLPNGGGSVYIEFESKNRLGGAIPMVARCLKSAIKKKMIISISEK